MKAKNLLAKPYIIHSDTRNIVLVPAGEAVEIPKDADHDYLAKLASNKLIEITEDEPIKKTYQKKNTAIEDRLFHSEDLS